MNFNIFQSWWFIRFLSQLLSCVISKSRYRQWVNGWAQLRAAVFQQNLFGNSIWGFPGGSSGKEPACQCRRYKSCGFDPQVGKIPWRRKWQSTPIFLPGKSYGQRSLAGYSPRGCQELDTTEWLTVLFGKTGMAGPTDGSLLTPANS